MQPREVGATTSTLMTSICKITDWLNWEFPIKPISRIPMGMVYLPGDLSRDLFGMVK